MIQTVMSRCLGLKKGDEDYRRVSLILISILSCIAVTAFYCFYNTVLFDHPRLFLIDLTGLLTGLVALVLLLCFKRTVLASFVLLLMVTGVCFMVILERGNLQYNLAWALLCPVMGIFLLGYRYGILYCAVYLAAVIWVCVSGLANWSPAPWTPSALVNLVAVYLLLFMVACYYEASRQSAHALLKESKERFATMAFTDVLTGLHNRRYMEDVMLNRTQPAYLAMVDVDDFKRINDDYGHTVGDEVLQDLAQEMNLALPNEAVIARWGGEEFAILMTLESVEHFEQHLKVLVQSIADRAFGVDVPVTVSVGGVLHQADQHKTALRDVDEALYQAKIAGKNGYRLAANCYEVTL